MESNFTLTIKDQQIKKQFLLKRRTQINILTGLLILIRLICIMYRKFAYSSMKECNEDYLFYIIGIGTNIAILLLSLKFPLLSIVICPVVILSFINIQICDGQPFNQVDQMALLFDIMMYETSAVIFLNSQWYVTSLASLINRASAYYFFIYNADINGNSIIYPMTVGWFTQTYMIYLIEKEYKLLFIQQCQSMQKATKFENILNQLHTIVVIIEKGSKSAENQLKYSNKIFHQLLNSLNLYIIKPLELPFLQLLKYDRDIEKPDSRLSPSKESEPVFYTQNQGINQQKKITDYKEKLSQKFSNLYNKPGKLSKKNKSTSLDKHQCFSIQEILDNREYLKQDFKINQQEIDAKFLSSINLHNDNIISNEIQLEQGNSTTIIRQGMRVINNNDKQDQDNSNIGMIQENIGNTEPNDQPETQEALKIQENKNIQQIEYDEKTFIQKYLNKNHFQLHVQDIHYENKLCELLLITPYKVKDKFGLNSNIKRQQCKQIYQKNYNEQMSSSRSGRLEPSLNRAIENMKEGQESKELNIVSESQKMQSLSRQEQQYATNRKNQMSSKTKKETICEPSRFGNTLQNQSPISKFKSPCRGQIQIYDNQV
eukprot:403374485